jgi:hypothetical protein
LPAAPEPSTTNSDWLAIWYTANTRVLFWPEFLYELEGRGRQLCPLTSDLDFLRNIKRVVDLHAKVSDGALDLGVPERSRAIMHLS